MESYIDVFKDQKFYHAKINNLNYCCNVTWLQKKQCDSFITVVDLLLKEVVRDCEIVTKQEVQQKIKDALGIT